MTSTPEVPLPELPKPFGWWVKFADGSEDFLRHLPTDPDVEDMPSRATPLYARPAPPAIAREVDAALDPVLAKFYGVDSVGALLHAMERHIESLQDAARRNVKPWEDTFPPTLLPRYIRENGLPEPEPPATVYVYTAHDTPPLIDNGRAWAINSGATNADEAADAFWRYWRENGETHRHGYYESTWGAINAALRIAGVTRHDYGDAPPPSAPEGSEK